MSEISSTGRLGLQIRSDERGYGNYEDPVTAGNVGDFTGDTLQFLAQPNKVLGTDMPITRAVMRAVVDWPVIQRAIENGILDLPEAVAPLPTGEQLVYFARNTEQREVAMQPICQRHAERIRGIQPAVQELPGGLHVTRQVADPVQLEGLWSGTFGWDDQGCKAFATRINGQWAVTPSERTVWFRGVEDSTGRLVGAAMAERLDMPSARSRTGSVALAELTEWAVDPAWRGNGLMPTLVQQLASLVETDLADVPYLAFAECNMTSGADRAAARAGMVVPLAETSRGRVSQVLAANVRVGDGYEPKEGYRSFTLLTVPGLPR